MPARHLNVHGVVPAALAEGVARLQASLNVPDGFPAEVLAAAEEASRSPRLPAYDRTDLDLVTIDPPGARDLDQAVHIARDGAGYLVSYAIADVAAFVRPGDPIDGEAHRRGQTFYAPHRRFPLHPPVLSEGAASLLPGEVRPALLWQIRLDHDGATLEKDVRRALVRSRAQLSYDEVQLDLDTDRADDSLHLLQQVGLLREEREVARGGVSLNIPEQEIEVRSPGRWRLQFRRPVRVEDWNAQISLLTGMAAARIMLDHNVGILRTLPPAEPTALAKLRRTAAALDIAWPTGQPYPEFIRTLDMNRPEDAAMGYSATMLFRGADYDAFVGSRPLLDVHAALATEYSHVTAPLRRLVDRYTEETCVALCAGRPVPEWVLAAYEKLPEEMNASNARAATFEHSIIDMTEALTLSGRVGQEFLGTVIELRGKAPERARVMISKPAVEADVVGTPPLGERLRVRLDRVDVAAGRTEFSLIP
ncbi:RNB domain-containing ribonuclease [Raineyella fluvialis]|uniref:RNB domain-containing ribonuclease n=1 Tax=Raineyella fluvialis TaxID=2662261 RepID=A0A5Q2FAY0_9ACTN|nr:RNB domain-containing ribonuclease [Raineyella fluvialis]QGF24170.1 RNB domain-containing ribonuclease [Raineyella fluvialis]